MSADGATAVTVLKNQYRCPDGYDVFRISGPLSSAAGFFRFGHDAVCYARHSRVSSRKSLRKGIDELPDLLSSAVVGNDAVTLPFDPAEAIENLRWERYTATDKGITWTLIQKPYYAVRPLMPVGFRKHLQRAYLKRWRRIVFPRWPVDRTVESLFEQFIRISLQSRQEKEMPFVWFWPKGYSACLNLTHDIESAAGRDFCTRLVDLDEAFGMKSSFQIVPEESYEVTPIFLEWLRVCGREINLHGLTHDGQLFRNRKKFLRHVREINRYARQYKAAGFRSPVLYRNLEWFAALDISYDMSVPNVAHLDPQRGGCCTVLPYFVGNIVELPLTTTQDYALFNILGERSIRLWEQQIQMVLEKHGLISFNIHPDYIMTEPYAGLYRELLQLLKRICAERNVWIALPGEVNQWWRQRQQMGVVLNPGQPPSIAGPHSDRAVLAYARLRGDEIVYECPEFETRTTQVMPTTASVVAR
jgi:hypothetical protein